MQRFSKSSSEESLYPKTVVSFVLGHDDCTEDGMDLKYEEYSKCEVKEYKQKARHRGTIFMSILYAIILVIIGIVFPITEALLDQWRTSGVVAGFLMYMSGGSVIFITYLLVDVELTHRRQRKCKLSNKEQCTDNKASQETAECKKQETEECKKQYEDNVTFQNYAYKSEKLQNGEFILLSSVSDFHQRERGLSISSHGSVKNKQNGEVQKAKDKIESSDSVSDHEGNNHLDDLSFPSEHDSEEVMQFLSINTQTASQAHEGTSFYLRFGFLLFAIAYIMFLALEIDYFYLDDECYHPRKYAWVLFFQLTFVIVQSFFLFKHNTLPNTSAKKGKKLFRFGLMHVVATNLVIWTRALVSEIKDGVEHEESTHYQTSSSLLNDSLNETSCPEDELIRKATHYLFPFILEYSLIAVAIFLSMFMSLDIRISGEVLHSIKKYLRHARKNIGEATLTTEQQHSKMLDKAHTGLFIGILCFTGTIISFILVQYHLVGASNENDMQEEAEIIYYSTDLCVHTFAMAGVIVATIKLHHLLFSFLRTNTVDTCLLLLSLCALLLYTLFKAVCMFYTLNNKEVTDSLILDATCNLLIVLQALLQTIFIVAGLNKYSDKKEDQINKPGRGVITFLILVNISIWFLKSFTEKDITGEIMEEFYGVIPWQIILHITLPLMLFYRFHSSVCLADMWKSAYENEDSPIQYIDL